MAGAPALAPQMHESTPRHNKGFTVNSNVRTMLMVAIVILLGFVLYSVFAGGRSTPTPATTTTTPIDTTQPATNNNTPAQ